MLNELPFELLSQIYSNLTTAQSVSRLSITCRALHEYTAKEGWKIFLRTRFPSLPAPSKVDDYREASHGLTTLSRNWDRKAFLARYLDPSGRIISLPTWKHIPYWSRPQGQTMGYQPSIDSYEEWNGGDWGARKQILAYSAGTELLLRVKRTGSNVKTLWDAASPSDRKFYYDEYKHLVSWYRYNVPNCIEGRDDITSLKVIKPYQKQPGAERVESIVLGTASGELRLLNVGIDECRSLDVQSFATRTRDIHSIALSPAKSPLLAACKADAKIALYPIHQDQTTRSIDHISEIEITPDEGDRNNCRTWSAAFLSDDKLAVGSGPSSKSLRVYQVSPTGLVREPIRKFGFNGRNSQQLESMLEEPSSRISSTYSITSLPASSLGSHDAGQVFLSGDFDGTIRLHDLRSPSPCESTYLDSVNTSAIYSLQVQGRERIIAGTARHATLMVFDLRVSGGRAYRNFEVPMRNKGSKKDPNTYHSDSAEKKEKPYKAHYNWNLFLNARNRSHQTRVQMRSVESPIYSISLPSASSPTLFAGVENAIVQLDFTGILDPHPDSVFQTALERTQRGEIDVKKSWNPNGDVMNLGMYDNTDENSMGMNLWVQAGVGFNENTVPGLDERWRDPSLQEKPGPLKKGGRQWHNGSRRRAAQ